MPALTQALGISRTTNGAANFSTTAAFMVFLFGISHLPLARAVTLAPIQRAVCIIGHNWVVTWNPLRE
jgi:hypothetical protein